MKTLSLLFCGLAALLSSASAQPKLTHVLPSTGTTFVNTYFATDSNGVVPAIKDVNPGMPDDTVDVVASGVLLHGKPNSVAITARAHSDTTFLSYEANGDVWILNTGKSKEWQRLPFGMKPGKVRSTKPMLDTGSVLGNYYAINRHDDIRVVGWDTLSLGSSRIPAVHLWVVSVMVYDKKRMKDHEQPPTDHFENATNYWYAPSIGYFVKINFGWDAQYFLNQVLKDFSSSIGNSTGSLD